MLSTGRTLYHYNAATQTRRSEGLTAKQPEAFVEVHPRDARRSWASRTASSVDVVTRRGRVRARAMHSRQVKANVRLDAVPLPRSAHQPPDQRRR